jgi:hypothetical protein
MYTTDAPPDTCVLVCRATHQSTEYCNDAREAQVLCVQGYAPEYRMEYCNDTLKTQVKFCAGLRTRKYCMSIATTRGGAMNVGEYCC